MTAQTVAADTKEDGVQFIECRLLITEAAGFTGSPRGVIFGIEKKHNVPAGEVKELNILAGARWQIEIRCRISNDEFFLAHGLGPFRSGERVSTD